MMISRLKLHNSRIYNSQDGFTLVELMVTSVIIGILGLLLNSLFGGFFTSSLDNQRRMELQREVDRAMNQIVRVLRVGTDAIIGNNGTGGSNNKLTIVADGGNVVFQSDPGVAHPSPLERDTINIIRDIVNADIGVDDLLFSSVVVNNRIQVTTTLSMKYVDTVGMDQVVEFRTVTILRNS